VAEDEEQAHRRRLNGTAAFCEAVCRAVQSMSACGALRTLHSCLNRPPFALSLSKRPIEPFGLSLSMRPIEPFALSLSKRPIEPFGLSLSKPRGPCALRQAQRERLCAMSAMHRQRP
jgi:hypothetical protein